MLVSHLALGRAVLALALVGIGCLPARAIVYPSIPVNANVNDIRAAFPRATIEDVSTSVGWLKANERLMSISGGGLGGTIYVKMSDMRPIWEKLYREAEVGSKAEAFFDERRRYPEDKTFQTDWVRMSFDRPVPLANIVERFGKFHKKALRNDDYSRYVAWTSGPNNGLSAQLSDDGKKVESLDYNPTAAEIEKYRYLLWRKFTPEAAPTPEAIEEPSPEPL